MKRGKFKKLFIEVRGMVDKTPLEKIGEIAKLFEQPIGVRLEEGHYTEPKLIKCPRCGSEDIMKYGIRNGIQEYICGKCKRKFTARDLPFGMRTPIDQVGASLTMYYNGLSLTDVAQYLNQTHNNPVDRSTVYHWLTKELLSNVVEIPSSIFFR